MVRDLAVLESLNQQVLDALPSGILFCDTDYIVRRVNACYAALLGGKVSSILGRPLTELNPATRAPIVIKNGKPELGDLCTLPLFGDNYKFVVGEFALIELLCISCHDLFPNMEINTLIISIITAIGRTT